MTNEIEQLSEQLYFSDIEKLVSAGHSVKIPIQGNSMYPFLIDGRDRVSIKEAGNISKGDIILIKTEEDQYILHRVYNIRHEKYILMGDRNLHIMEVCMKKNIIGKVYEIERNGKKINP
ncbi:S24/S26 family peptidase [Bacteroides caecigallinarum]|nr:S24/S26 family peptidase [Bacteroides caecigallinarum]MCF2736349.1 S24/S26 family peptidase [Bacteroides caecigallinarum]